MTADKAANGSGRMGVRRQLRAQRVRERQLVLRHRWYAGGVATVISAALIFTGVSSPALADTQSPSPTPTSSDTATPTPTPTPSPSASESTPADPAVPTPSASPTDASPSPSASPTNSAPAPKARLLAPQAQLQAAGTPLICASNYFYNVESGGGLNQIVNGGSITSLGSWSAVVTGSANGLAIGAGGAVVYGIDRTGGSSQDIAGVLKYDPSTLVFSKYPGTAYATGNSGSLVAGAVNLADGRYLFGGTNAGANTLQFKIYSFNPSTSAISVLGYIDTGLSNDAGANGDMAFDSAGNLYIVLSGGQVSIFTVTAATLAGASGGQLARSVTAPQTLSLNNVNGIAFDADGYVYLGNGSTAAKFNPTNWVEQPSSIGGLNNSTDLASCNSPANLTVKKNVAGRVSSTDQFTMKVTYGSTTVATATTTGTATGIQAQQIGPIPVIAGLSYTISEVMASGTGSQYASSWSCDNGQSGTGTSGTVTIPSANGATVVCTFTNAPLVTPVKINKIVQDAAGLNPTNGVGWTVGAALSGTTGGGTATSTPSGATQVTDANGAASWSIAYSTTVTKTNIAVSETQKAGYDFVSGSCTVTKFGGGTSTVNLPNAAGASVPGVGPGDSVACTITNKVQATKLTLVKKVVLANGGTAVATDWTLTAAPPTGAGLSGKTGSAAVTGAVITPNVAYTLGENGGPSGYTASAWVCDGGTLSGGKVTVAQGGNVTCTITNSDQPATITLVKNVVNDNGGTALPGAWTLTADGPTKVTGPGNSAAVTNQTVKAGTYTLSESGGPAGYTPSAWTCTAGTLTGSSLVLPNGVSTTCTITNTAKKPTLTLQKQVVNTGGGISAATDWTLTATSGATKPIDGKGTIVSPDLAAISAPVLGNTTYTLTENGPSGYTPATTWVCFDTNTQAPISVANNNQVKTTVGQDVTCRIVNTAVAGTATVVKNVASLAQNADGTWSITYTIVVTNTSTASTVTYNLADALKFGTGITVAAGDATWVGPNSTSGTFAANGTATLATGVALTKAVGTHTYTVTVKASIAAGTNLTPSAWQCDTGPTPKNGGFLNSATMTVGGTPTTVTACVPPSFPVVTKVAGSPVNNTDGSWNVSYTITVQNPGAVAIRTALTDAYPTLPSGWTLAGGVWTVTPQGGAPITNPTSAASPIWSGTLPPTTTYTYVVTGKLTPAAGATPIGDCATQGKGLNNTATATSGAIVVNASACATITSPPVSVEKSDGTVQQLANGTWQIDYTILVHNTSAQSTVFTLADVPTLGTGFTLISGTWQGTTPAANTPIAGFTTIPYAYRVIASFNPQTPNPQLTCDPVKGGAFFNTANIAFPGGTASDTGCGAPASPTVTKTAAAPTQATDGTWQLTYTVTVTNPSGIQLYYSLADAPVAPPAGVTVTTPWAIAGPAALNGGSFTAAAPAWNGGSHTQVGTGTLVPKTSHVFTVTAGVTLSADVKAADLVCGSTSSSGKGVWNTTTVTNGVSTTSAEACSGITTPPVTIVKSDGTASQAANGDWTIDYTITVTNSSSTIATVYTLTDTPSFDASFSIVSQGWQGTAPTPNKALAKGGSDAYHYVVVAKAAKTPVDPSALTCTPAGKGGFFNSATVAYPGGTASATGCAVPAKPVVQKTAQTSTQNTVTGDWTLTYTLAVSNPSNLSIAYNLSDTAAALPTGVTGGAWAAGDPTVVGGGTFVRNASWAGSGPLATGILPGSAVHTYTVTRTVSVASTVTNDALTCGQTPNEGGGMWNTASITNGIAVQDSSACATITRPDVTIKKSVTGTQQLADGSWDVTYNVVVTNSSTTAAATYSLNDTLVYGSDITVTGASWTGPGVPPSGSFSGNTATLATNKVLAPKVGSAGVDTYTVTAHATIPAAAWTKNPSTLLCNTGDRPAAGGFLNSATVTVNGSTHEDHACSAPELPTVAKAPVSAVQDPASPDDWTVTYTLTVTGGKYDTHFSLSDTPGFPSTVTLGAGTAQLGAGAPFAITSGMNFETNALIAANTTKVYTVTWKATLTGDYKPADGVCTEGSGHGFFNSARLTSGDVTSDKTACIPIADRVYPSIAKTVTSTTQAPDGTWVVGYDVTVTLPPKGASNPAGLSAKYTLTDTPMFGAGITIGTATWNGQTSGTFTMTPQPLATNYVIAAGATQTYHISVSATVTKAAIDDHTTSCLPGTTPDAGGFLNTAQLTSAGQKIPPANACSEPIFPTITKTPVGAATLDSATGLWTVSYDITVTYPTTSLKPRPAASYTLTDAPTLPSNVTLSGDWTATAGTNTPAPTNGTFNGTGTWTILSGGVLDPDVTSVSTHVFHVTAKVNVTGPSEPTECGDNTGIAVWNKATLTSGAWSPSSDACQVVHYDDVSIVKTTSGVEGPVEAGGSFDYVLTVTNNGTRPAANVVVTDPVPGRLTVTGIDLPAGWANANTPAFVGADNTVSVNVASLAVGATATITLHVTVKPVVVPAIPHLGPNDPAPPAPVLPDPNLVNNACVAATHDQDPTNNCSSITVTTKDIAAIVYTRCVADAPLIGFVISKSDNLKAQPVNFGWTPNTGGPTTSPASVNKSYPGGTSTVTDEFPWVGTAFTPSGVSIDYPGWRALVASDYAPGGGYYLPGTTTVMTPAEQAQFVFNGLILDPSQLDYAWRNPTTVLLSVNPSESFTVDYPPAVEGCAVARHSNVQIKKTASVEKTDPGKSFTYTLETNNVSDDSAADGVVVTDTIPADLKITDVTWTGKTDAGTFPNWKTCAVSGQDSAGYGGTLTCTLFGPLQPAGSGLGPTSAPTITLTASVNPTTKASVLTNIGVVDYYTFGDPTDTGHYTSQAVVLLSALPATGGSPLTPLIMLGFLVILGGVTTILVARRRRGDAKLRL